MHATNRTSLTALLTLALTSLTSLAGCGKDACDQFCERSLACSTQAGCTLQDQGGAEDVCSKACHGGLAGLDDATKRAVEDCMVCLSTNGSACDEQPAACKAVCDTDPVKTGGEIVGKELEGVSADEQLACTNGDSALGGATCTGGGSGDGTNEKCDSDCSNGSNRVAAECAGMTGGTFDCLCTDGASAGKSFTVKSCDELFSDNLWNRCNVK